MTDNTERLPDDGELQRQTAQMRAALAIDGSTAHSARVLAEKIAADLNFEYSPAISLDVLEWRLISAALREYALIGIGQRIMDSTDAQLFRWLLKHHSGTDGKRCWIGGVDFRGTDVRDAIDAALSGEEKRE